MYPALNSISSLSNEHMVLQCRYIASRDLSGPAFVYITSLSARAVAQGAQKLWLTKLELSSHAANPLTAGMIIPWALSIQTLRVLNMGSTSRPFPPSAQTPYFATELPSISGIPATIGMLPQPATQPALFHCASAFQQGHTHLSASPNVTGFAPQPSPQVRNFNSQQKQSTSLTTTLSPMRMVLSQPSIQSSAVDCLSLSQHEQISGLANPLGLTSTVLPQSGRQSHLVRRSHLSQREWSYSLTLVLPQAGCDFSLVHHLFISQHGQTTSIIFPSSLMSLALSQPRPLHIQGHCALSCPSVCLALLCLHPTHQAFLVPPHHTSPHALIKEPRHRCQHGLSSSGPCSTIVTTTRQAIKVRHLRQPGDLSLLMLPMITTNGRQTGRGHALHSLVTHLSMTCKSLTHSGFGAPPNPQELLVQCRQKQCWGQAVVTAMPSARLIGGANATRYSTLSMHLTLLLL